MSAMVNFEIPWINIMSKMDLVSTRSKDPASGRNGFRTRKDISRYLDPDPLLIAPAANEEEEKPFSKKYNSLNRAIVQLIEENPLVSFLPLDLTVTDSIERVMSHIDYTMQYGEDEEPKEPNDMDEGDF
ncbi:ATP binding protein [Serendipita sp. 407]|nr:ATP binding protein [Serendipita sp. 407]